MIEKQWENGEDDENLAKLTSLMVVIIDFVEHVHERMV